MYNISVAHSSLIIFNLYILIGYILKTIPCMLCLITKESNINNINIYILYCKNIFSITVKLNNLILD